MKMERKSWEEFITSGLLWWANRMLGVFGWTIVPDFDADGRVTDVYPARTDMRLASEPVDLHGFDCLHRWLMRNIKELSDETSQK